jgi:hypothetical protein
MVGGTWDALGGQWGNLPVNKESCCPLTRCEHEANQFGRSRAELCWRRPRDQRTGRGHFKSVCPEVNLTALQGPDAEMFIPVAGDIKRPGH